MIWPFPLSFILTYEGSRASAPALSAELAKAGVKTSQFNWIDGQKAGLLTSHTFDLNIYGHKAHIGPGMVANYLGNLAILSAVEAIGVDSVVIFEDDAWPKQDWTSRLDSCVAVLPKNWDMLFLGSCCCEDKPDKQRIGNTDLWRVYYANCTHAYAIRRKAIPSIRRALEKIYTNVDIATALHAMPSLEVYAVLPRLFDQTTTALCP